MVEQQNLSDGSLSEAWARRRLLGLVFALGCSSLIAQSLLVREFLVVCFGNELSLGVIFASWLIGTATGGATGGWLARRPRWAGATLLTGAFAAGFILPAQLTLIRASRALLQVPTGELIPLGSLLTLGLLLGAPGSFCLGLTFAPACSLLAERGPRLGPAEGSTAIGRVYVVEAVGALFGGSLFSLVLAGRVATFPLAAVVAVTLIGLAVWAVRSRRQPRALRWIALVGVVVVVAAALLLEPWTRELRWQSLQPGVELVETVDSRYQNLALGQLAGQYSIYGNGEVMGTFPDPYSAAQQAHLFMAQHPAPKRVLLVGGGIEGLAVELLKHPITRLDYVSLDRAVSGLVRPYLPPDLASIFSDARFRPHYADGRYFVKQAQGPYDLVIVNVPDPRSAMINRFYTLEFCREVADILAPDGVLVTGAGETHGYLGEEVGRYAGSVYRTLKEVFPEVVVTPVGATYFFAARQPGLVSDDPEVLAQRYRASGVQSEYFAPELYAQFFPPEWVEFIKDALSRYSDVPINTDQKPVTYFYGLVLWDRYSGSHLTPALTWLRGLNPIAPLALLVAGAVLVALYQLFGRGNLARMLRFNLTWTVATTGCAAMAIELVLVFAFQNTFGYVYEKVGLIIGVFMFGLAAGGLSATGLVARRPRLGLAAMLAVNAALMLFAGSLPGALGLLSRGTYHAQEVRFGVLVWMGGLLTGAHFPLAAHLLQLTGAGVARAAGRLDWADHIGACAGALVTGVVLVPVVGLAGASYVAAGLAGTSLLLLSVSAWRLRQA